MTHPLWASLRPRHWVKQVFVFPGLVFSGQTLQGTALVRTAGTAFFFCLAASAGYLVNDLCNRHEDWQNPRTAHRPLAQGRLSWRAAAGAATVLALVALLGAWQLRVAEEIGGYLGLSLLYSFGIKRVPVLDLLSLVLMYLARLVAGCKVIAVTPSPWLLMCGGSLALLLSWGKRLGETRSPYPKGLLHRGLPPLAAAVAGLYLAYTLQPLTQDRFGLGLCTTFPWVAAALGRYAKLAVLGRGDPMTALEEDAPLRALTAIWSLHTGLVVLLASGTL